MKPIGAVLGNGPSRDKFDFVGDVIIGCNIPGEGYSVDATVITDVEIVWVMKDNPDLITCPLVISTIAYEKMKELKIEGYYDIHDVFKPIEWYTSGHYATLYLTQSLGCDFVNIWGCDSYFINDATSSTDLYIAKSGELFYKQWRAAWLDIFQSNPNVKYNIKRI